MANRTEQRLIDNLISGFQNSDAYRSLPPAAKTSIGNSVEQYAATYSNQISNQISQESNYQLDAIPANLIGVKNPVNVVSQNLSSTQLTNNISPVVTNNLLGPISAQAENELFNLINSSLPAGVLGGAQFDIVNGILGSVVGNSVSNLINGELSDFSDGVFSRSNTVVPFVREPQSYFSDPNTALQRIDEDYSRTLTAQSLQRAQNFDVNNDENISKLVTKTTGFIDPSATYPTKDYADRAETNKLATGDVNGTIVQTKEVERTLGIQLPSGQSFEQPEIPFKGEYPYNKVIQTESGHIIEMDDTPGAERLQVYHRTGTFVEIDSNGSVVKKTKGSNYEIIDKNGYISVAGEAAVSVKGNVRVYIGGDANIEVEGDTNLTCFNDITMQASGRVDISATEEINLHSANINIEADVNLSMKGDVNAFLTATNIYNKANLNNYSETLGNHFITSAGSYYNQAGSQVHFKSGSTFNVDGSQVWLNSGRSTTSLPSLYSISSNIGLIGERKDITYFTIPDPVSPNFKDSIGFIAEDSEFTQEANEQLEKVKQFGIALDSDLNTRAVVVGSDTPRSENFNVIMPNQTLLGETYLPDNYDLSENFTLGMLSSKAVVTNNPVVAQAGLSYGELVYNLQGMALNILEPLLALYPNMFVTSAFRTLKNSSSTSDHPRGKAVDIQFKNVPKSEYFNIAKKLATQLNYDKLLLEYKTFGTGLPWIHISFDVTKQRKIVLTYFNNKKYGEGLSNLA